MTIDHSGMHLMLRLMGWHSGNVSDVILCQARVTTHRQVKHLCT